ncbi:MAG: hypothetical protein WD005_01095, partial [Haliea sp.]
ASPLHQQAHSIERPALDLNWLHYQSKHLKLKAATAAPNRIGPDPICTNDLKVRKTPPLGFAHLQITRWEV